MSIRQPRYKQIFSSHESGAEKAQLASVLWAEIIEHLGSIGETNKTRLGQADRWVRLRVEYEFLYPTAMEEGPTRTADSGGQYANMNWSAIGKLNEQLLKLEDSMLISPKAAEGKSPIKPIRPKGVAADKFLANA